MMEKLLVKICFDMIHVKRALGGWGSLWDAGKSVLGLCKTCYGVLKGGKKGGEREGIRCFEEEQAW